MVREKPPGGIAHVLRTGALMCCATAMTAAAAAIEPRFEAMFGERIGGILGDRDTRHLAFERTWRIAYWGLGQPLPGTPNLDELDSRLRSAGLKLGAPVFLRVFKREFELELWMKDGERFRKFATYPICRYSGRLGPKLKQGDRQSPEGIYTVSASQLNPGSRWHRSFNLGFPNTFDRAHGRTGSYLMVHGGCSSIGCYAITNDAVDEIWRIITAALSGGQKRFQVQSLPFRMTDAALAAQKGHRWHGFWQQLKVAYDHFEEDRIPPKVAVCRKAYQAQAGRPGSDGSDTVSRRCITARSIATY